MLIKIIWNGPVYVCMYVCMYAAHSSIGRQLPGAHRKHPTAGREARGRADQPARADPSKNSSLYSNRIVCVNLCALDNRRV